MVFIRPPLAERIAGQTDQGAAGSGGSATGSSDADDDASAGGSDADDDSTDTQEPGSSVDPSIEPAAATADERAGSAVDPTKEQAADPTGSTTSSAAADGKDDSSAADAADAAAAKADEQVSDASGSVEDVPAASHASVSALSVEPTSIETAAPEQAARALAVAAALDPIFVPYTLPSIPTGGSWLDVLIASVWRDISHTWFNKKPVATYTSEQVLLTTTYTVDVVDPNGDPLSFAIIQPEHGLVTWVPFTNKFLYTPDLFYTGDPVPDGEVGEVVVTVLNPDYPLVRFGTGDLSAVLPGPCPTGRSNTRIRGWLGRADQTAKVRGMFVHPSQVAEVLRRHPEAGRGRLVIEGEMAHPWGLAVDEAHVFWTDGAAGKVLRMDRCCPAK